MFLDSTKQKEIYSFEVLTCNNKENKKSILLIGNETFLKEKWIVITEYTKKIDPCVKIKECKVKKIPTDQLQNEKFAGHTHYMKITLPRPIHILYGQHEINKYGNCHGSAVVAAGLFPAMSSLPSPCLLKDKTQEVALNKIECGDLVFLSKGSLAIHSFVYLDADISLTMNGLGHELILSPNAKILELYGFESNSLVNSHNENIQVIRKNTDWRYPEEIMPELMLFYKISNEYLTDSSVMQTILEKLTNFAEKSQNTVWMYLSILINDQMTNIATKKVTHVSKN